MQVGIDGCSAPNFAVPLYNAALGFARLCNPKGLGEARARACRQITSAMTSYPEMVSGHNEFDCRLMQTGKGRIVCKRGAEGFQAIGLMPGVLGAGAPGVGIAFKVSDGDLLFRTLNIEPLNRVRPTVTLEILRQIGALSDAQLKELADFGPTLPIKNHRGIVVGESGQPSSCRRRPCRSSSTSQGKTPTAYRCTSPQAATSIRHDIHNRQRQVVKD